MPNKTYFSTLEVSMHDAKFLPDVLSKGASSRWLENDKQRLRLMIYPAGYEADHTCCDGHAFYVVYGKIIVKLDDEITVWEAGDAFIIPDETPHILINSYEVEAKIVVID